MLLSEGKCNDAMLTYLTWGGMNTAKEKSGVVRGGGGTIQLWTINIPKFDILIRLNLVFQHITICIFENERIISIQILSDT